MNQVSDEREAIGFALPIIDTRLKDKLNLLK